jgi:hypothetical protein
MRFSLLLLGISLIGAAAASPATSADLPLNGYYIYQLGRAGESSELYRSVVFLDSSGTNLSIYRTYQIDPLGRNSRCGGLGCDLEKKGLAGVISFSMVPSGLRVVKATGSADFLLNAFCVVKDGPLGALLACKADRFPGNKVMKTVVLFSPGS